MNRILLISFLLLSTVCSGLTLHGDGLHNSANMPSANAQMFGLSSTATGAVNKAAILAAIASNSAVFIPDGTYTIDNSASPLIISRAGAKLFGSRNAILKAATESVDLVRIMADDVAIDGISFQGPGGVTSDTSWAAYEDRPALVAIGATGSVVIHRAVVTNCKFIDPAILSVQSFKTLSTKITNNDCISTAVADPNTVPFLAHISVQTSAGTIVSGNSVEGMCQGIGGGGNSADTFDSEDGVVSGYNRNFSIANNVLKRQSDHAIYFSDACQDYSYTNNTASSANEVLKFQGIGVLISGNTLNSAAKGLMVGNNCSAVSIVGNNGKTNASNNTNVHGIYIGTVVGSTMLDGYQNITITGNTLVDQNGGLGSAIYVDAIPSLSDGSDLNIIKKLVITGNSLIGWADAAGGSSTNASIYVYQRSLNSGLGSPAEDITISGNNIAMDDSWTQARSGIIIRGGCKGWTISGNNIRGIGGDLSAGAVLHGCSNGCAAGNSINTAANATASPYGGFREMLPTSYGVASDVTYVATGTYNTYGLNRIPSGASFFILARDSSSEILHRLNSYATPNANVAFFPYYRYTSVFWEPQTNISMIPSTTASLYTFEQNCEVEVKNLSATNTITFDPAGLNYLIPASSSALFVQIGTGTNANTWKGGK